MCVCRVCLQSVYGRLKGFSCWTQVAPDPGAPHFAVPAAGPLQKVVEAYGVNLVEGVMSHQMKQFIIDGNKCVLNKPSPEAKVEDSEFSENEVYAIDIVVSSGEGKTKVLDEKETTIYKCERGAGVGASGVCMAIQAPNEQKPVG